MSNQMKEREVKGKNSEGSQTQGAFIKGFQGQAVHEEGSSTEQQTPEDIIKELRAELNQERETSKRHKRSIDKLTSEAENLKKALRDAMTEHEQTKESELEVQVQLKEHMKVIESENALLKATNQFLAIGMPAKMAGNTAKASLTGDNDTVIANINEHMQNAKKEAYREWLGSRPEPNCGNGEDDLLNDGFLKGFNSVKNF